MKKIIDEIKKLELCNEEEYFRLLELAIHFVKKENIELAGLYVNNNNIVLVVPYVVDNYTMSVALHEAGHLYDYYVQKDIVDSEDTALLWEFKCLLFHDENELLAKRKEYALKELIKKRS